MSKIRVFNSAAAFSFLEKSSLSYRHILRGFALIITLPPTPFAKVLIHLRAF